VREQFGAVHGGEILSRKARPAPGRDEGGVRAARGARETAGGRGAAAHAVNLGRQNRSVNCARV